MENGKRIVIVGAGITGLTIAFRLRSRGIPFLLLEESDAAGGKIRTIRKDGFELDLGPITCARNPSLDTLIKEAGLENSVLTPSVAFKNRFIFSGGRLHAVVPHPLKLLTSGILSWKSKLTFFRDLNVSSSSGLEDESVADFVRRHFNEEVLQKLFDPILGGIYAGDIKKLSVLSVLPMLKQLENENGSVIRGLWKNRRKLNLGREIISFRGGFQSLTGGLVNLTGSSLLLNTKAESINYSEQGLTIGVNEQGQQKQINCSKVILAIPAQGAAKLLDRIDPAISGTLRSIPYQGVSQLYCAVKKPEFKTFDGFGFLVPAAENKGLMGAVHNSALFAGKAPEDYELFTLFCKNPGVDLPSIAQHAIENFASILNMRSLPEVVHQETLLEAIPQFNVGHHQKIQKITSFEANHPGLRIGGNYISGVSVGDCIKFGDRLAKEAIEEDV